MLSSPRRETPKNVINKIEKKSVFDFLVDFFFASRAHPKKRGKKKKVLTWNFCKVFAWCFLVFLNSPSEQRRKIYQQKPNKKNRPVGGWVWGLADVRGVGGRGGPSIFLAGPSPTEPRCFLEAEAEAEESHRRK
jgi:hypothetical protein